MTLRDACYASAKDAIMAVFTEVGTEDLDGWLRSHARMRLGTGPEAIAQGIENTNYRFTNEAGDAFVFTVVEVWGKNVAEFCLNLARHFHDERLPVPETVRLADGSLTAPFAGKPASVTRFVHGRSLSRPGQEHCRLIGALCAQLHKTARGFAGPCVPNPRGCSWRAKTAGTVSPALDEKQRKLLADGLLADRKCAAAELPEAAAHCDLFRNNVLWRNEKVAGIIDFYFAGKDRTLFDLCVTAVDWCMNDKGAIFFDNLAALLAGYQSQRALTARERVLFPDMIAAASLRFWISRLLDKMRPREAKILTAHNPADFCNRLGACLRMRSEIIKTCGSAS